MLFRSLLLSIPLLQTIGAVLLLFITQIHDHQSSTIQGAVPLLVVDAWEHAWYLQFQNEKAKHFEAIWNLWNWKDVAARLTEAQSVGLHLQNVADKAA